MKKIIFICAFVIISTCTFSQVDSTSIQNLFQTGVAIADATNNNIIPNVPNSITGSLITLVVGMVIRFFEKRHLRKQGKLND